MKNSEITFTRNFWIVLEGRSRFSEKKKKDTATINGEFLLTK